MEKTRRPRVQSTQTHLHQEFAAVLVPETAAIGMTNNSAFRKRTTNVRHPIRNKSSPQCPQTVFALQIASSIWATSRTSGGPSLMGTMLARMAKSAPLPALASESRNRGQHRAGSNMMLRPQRPRHTSFRSGKTHAFFPNSHTPCSHVG